MTTTSESDITWAVPKPPPISPVGKWGNVMVTAQKTVPGCAIEAHLGSLHAGELPREPTNDAIARSIKDLCDVAELRYDHRPLGLVNLRVAQGSRTDDTTAMLVADVVELSGRIDV